MRYVGIDPSTKTGLVILNNKGDVLLNKEVKSAIETDPQRFINIALSITWELRKDDIICIEGFSYGSKGRGVSTQYGIGWMIRAELIKHGYKYHDISPSAVKKFATGKGNTSKDGMVLPIYKHWGFESDSDNVRDAFVLAKIAQGLKGISPLTRYQSEVLDKIGG